MVSYFTEDESEETVGSFKKVDPVFPSVLRKRLDAYVPPVVPSSSKVAWHGDSEEEEEEEAPPPPPPSSPASLTATTMVIMCIGILSLSIIPLVIVSASTT